ncbi:MAG: sensor histidine kinase [Salinigranum sp.]
MLSSDGTLIEVNEAALAFAGVDSDDVVGRPFPETPWWTHDGELQSQLREWIATAAAGEHVRYTADHVSPDGEEITVDGVIRPVTDADGRVVSLVAEGRDVTERRASQRRLERQNRRLDEFASVVSHDLRNPLNVAEGRLSLAREECESEHLDAVGRAHERMRLLIEDLLTVAREGETAIEVEPLELADAVDACWRNVATAGATLVAETDRTIQADPGLLYRLLENLMRNAVEHGGEAVTVTVLDCEGGFAVEDDGPGIPGDERDRVFEMGYSTTAGGTGFGLSIVEQVVDTHGWEVGVGESPAGGARFEITGVEFADR